MTHSFDFNEIDINYYPLINQNFDREKIKSITKQLCNSYKTGEISEQTFHEVIENLLAFFIEHSFEDKIFSKTYRIDNKINKFNTGWKL